MTECSEMSAHKIQAPGNHRKERIQLVLKCLILKNILCYLFGYHVLHYHCLSTVISCSFLSIFYTTIPFYFKAILVVLTSFIRFCMLYPCGTGFISPFVFPFLFSPADVEQLPSLNRVVEQESSFLINLNIFLWRSISFILINTDTSLVELPYNSS